MAAVAHAPSPNLQPRSILKRPCHQSEPDLVNLPATLALSLSVTPPTPPRRCPNSVRFPPSPTLTRTFSAHSATAYDRSPIVVLPNSCALPARGCPGRTYHPSSCHAKQISSSRSPSPTRNSPKHSLATGAAPMPPLIVDVSSESDESDAVGSPPPPPAALFGAPTIYTPPEPLPALSLSFLPYPSALFRAPLSEPDERQYQSYEDEKEKDKQRRRREREHKAHRADGSGRRGGARARERNAASRATDGALEEEDDAEEDDQEGSSGGQYKSFGERSALTGCGFDDADEGCLGGF